MAGPYVEIKDSRVLVVERDGTDARLRMDLHLHIPAEDGSEEETIAVQHAALVVGDAVFAEQVEGGFLWVRGGFVRAAERCFEGILPLPFDFAGDAEVVLTGLEGAYRACGTRVRVETMGPVVTVQEIASE